MSIDFALADYIKVSFHNMDWWQGLETKGFIKTDKEGIVLEFQATKHDITDSLGVEEVDRSDVQEITIPFDEIESINLKQGWVETMIELKTRGMKALSMVPGSNLGQIVFCIPDKEKKTAKELVSTVSVRISELELERIRSQRESKAD